MYRDIPDLIETDRLNIRRCQIDDLDALFEAIQESLDDIIEWLPWARRDMTRLDSETFIRQSIGAFASQRSLAYHIFEKSSGRFVGGIGYPRVDWRIPRLEIGYWCRVSSQGKGYITEATKALVDIGFHKLHAKRIEICCDEDNVRSRRVPEKLGFQLEACLKKSLVSPTGAIKNNCIYVRFE